MSPDCTSLHPSTRNCCVLAAGHQGDHTSYTGLRWGPYPMIPVLEVLRSIREALREEEIAYGSTTTVGGGKADLKITTPGGQEFVITVKEVQ